MSVTNIHKATPWQIYKRLLTYTAKYRVFLIVAFIGMVVEALSAGYFASLMKPIVDETIIARNQVMLVQLPLVIVGLFLLRGLATLCTDYGMARTGGSVVRDLKHEVLRKLLRLPSSRFDAEPVAVMVSRLNYDTEQVSQSATEAIKVAVIDSLSIIVLLGWMFYNSPIVTLTMLVVAPVIAAVSTYVSRRYRMLNRKIQEGVGEVSHMAVETLAAQQEVKIYGAQEKASTNYLSLINRNFRLGMKVEVTRGSASAVVQLFAAIGLAVILYVAGKQVAADELSPGGFVSIIIAMMAMLPSLKRITNVQSAIQRGITAAERLFNLLDEVEEQNLGKFKLARAQGLVEFRDVSVRYNGKESNALNNVSFIARPGTVTAIVGRSGSGKSTLIRLLPRFYEADTGDVLLDGQSIKNYPIEDLRNQIALVGQKVMLFDDTVAANIAYGSDIHDEKRLIGAATAANASEFINKLPDGIQTRIGENGSLLSGGQRQRIAIARAILKDAPILILDEATAALDNESERLVQDALNHLIPDKTTLVIAHRLSTIEHADQVLVFDEGHLVEQGTHQELLKKNGVYAHLHNMQFRDGSRHESKA